MINQYEKTHNLNKADKELLVKLDPFINNLILAGIVIVFISTILLFVYDPFIMFYAIMDVAILIVLFAAYIFRNKLTSFWKMIILIFISLIYGIASFHLAGIFGTGPFMILTAVILSSIFLSRRMAWGITFVCSIHGLYILYQVYIDNMKYIGEIHNPQFMFATYIFFYVGIILVTVSTFISIAAIKKRLYDNIDTLNGQMLEIKEKNKALKEKNNEIEYLAYYNPLTTLPNRNYFYKKVSHAIENGHIGTMILIDLIEFNKVNAFYGVEVGDEVLKLMGSYVLDKLSLDYTIGYMGNNSIALWVEKECSEERLVSVYTHHQKILQKMITIDYELNANIVGVMQTDKMHTYDAVFSVADRALKYVKRNDDKNIVFIDEAYIEEMNEYELLKQAVFQAIKGNTFTVSYQEKRDIKTDTVYGVEALARWTWDRKSISPYYFIPIIEENGWAQEFGKVMFRKVFDDFNDLKSLYGDDVVVSINVSPQQLSNQSFVQGIKRLIEDYDVKAENIELEITENILLTDVDRVVVLLDKFREDGIKIALDDFGTGFSSMKYIVDLPIDVLKIDKSFIDHIVDDSRTRAIVKAMIEIAHATDISVVAEGVESVDQVHVLEELGCYKIQGYIYSIPKPLKELKKERIN